VANPVPIYPAQGTILDNVEDFMQHHRREVENQQRQQLGLAKGAPLPGKPENVPYPRMVYKSEYFSGEDDSERRLHYKQVESEKELKDAQAEGFFGSLQEAKDAFEQQQKKEKESPAPEKKK
jgi:hypothetical protein